MQADHKLDYGVLSAAGQDQLYLLARITAPSARESAERSPLNVCVVLDRSGSMLGLKLKYVKEATQFLVRQLDATDQFSLVTYDTNVDVAVPPTHVVHKDQMTQAIQAIDSGGGTNLSGGWLMGCQLVAQGIPGRQDLPRFNPLPTWLQDRSQKSLTEVQVNRVLLLTDGLANQGVFDPQRLVQMARNQREEGVPTTTIGVGIEFNEDLLMQMASEGGGNYYFIDNPDRVPQIFADELQTLAGVVAQNLVISLIPKSNARFVRQLNAYPSTMSTDTPAFRLGDLTADETKTLVLELSVPDLPDVGQIEIAQLRFDYDELQDEHAVHRTIELPVFVNVVADADFAGQAADPDVMINVLRLQAGQARRDAIFEADRGNFKEAAKLLNDTADAIDESDLDDDSLQAEHDMLREEAIDMDIGAQRYDAHARKVSTGAIYETSRLGDTGATTDLFHGLRGSRRAIERNGQTPARLRWNRQTFKITTDEVRIGRASDNDIVTNKNGVSRYHCRLVRVDDDLFLEDLESTNGTFANRGLVSGRFRLSVGDVMTVGPVLFRFLA